MISSGQVNLQGDSITRASERLKVYKLQRWLQPGCPTQQITYRDTNPLTPNDLYISRTTLLTSKRCILYIYSTNIGTEYFKHALYSPFFSLQNAVCFIMLTSLVPVLFTFYIQGVLKLKKSSVSSILTTRPLKCSALTPY